MKLKFCLLIFFLNCLSIYSQSIKKVSRDWTSITQSIDVKTNTKIKFKVVASVKVITDDDTAWAGIWARVDTKDHEAGFFDNMRDRPIKSNKWQSYEVEGTIDSNSNRLNFGGIALNNGKFFFDDFKLFIQNENGTYEPVNIDNSSFESKILKNNIIPKWSQGISKGKRIQVKEFNVSQSEDTNNGKYSLLIEGSGITPPQDSVIGNIEGTSPQIGSMISMLEDLKSRVENVVKNLSQHEIDHLHDDKANRIGSLIMHLAAAEAHYQVFTFEGRGFNEEEKKKWDTALNLDQGGRDTFKGHSAKYYLDIYNEVRAKTIAELKKRDDKWFAEIQESYGWSNHYCWFHVMEHQSSHLGQILFLKKRIPPESKIELKKKLNG